MLPERLSTDLTSLNEAQDRLAVVIELVVDAGRRAGERRTSTARVVRNHAKLAYNAVGAWLGGRRRRCRRRRRPCRAWTSSCACRTGVAQALGGARHEHGALELRDDRGRARASTATRCASCEPQTPNRAQAADRGPDDRGQRRHRALPRRAGLSVAAPRREVARALGSDRARWPHELGDDAAGARPIRRRSPRSWRSARRPIPDAFPDLSLTIIKLLGSGEYVVDPPGAEPPGHFGLAVRDYTHSTAPNRRYPDLDHAAARQGGARRPSVAVHDRTSSRRLAAHCTRQEDAANKVERQVRKSAPRRWSSSRAIGEQLRRASSPARRARARGCAWRRRRSKASWCAATTALDVGDRVHVRLVGVNVERGFIDFERA